MKKEIIYASIILVGGVFLVLFLPDFTDKVTKFSNKAALPNPNNAAPPIPDREDTLDREPYINETDHHYEVHLDLTGIKLDNVMYYLGDQVITIVGTFFIEQENEDAGEITQPQQLSPFYKIVPLPPDADSFNVTIDQQGDEIVATMSKLGQ